MIKGSVYENEFGGERSQKYTRVLTLTWLPHGLGCVDSLGICPECVFVITVDTVLDGQSQCNSLPRLCCPSTPRLQRSLAQGC